MGNSVSSNKNYRCYKCGVKGKKRKQGEQNSVCIRCNVAIPQPSNDDLDSLEYINFAPIIYNDVPLPYLSPLEFSQLVALYFDENPRQIISVGDTIEYENITFKAVQSNPSKGRFVPSTQIGIVRGSNGSTPLLRGAVLDSVKLSPSSASPVPAAPFTSAELRSFLLQRAPGTSTHLAVGDVVNYKGVEFSVSRSCFDGGFVGPTTTIEFGQPNDDLRRAKVALISSGREPVLVNNEDQHIITKYIRPFFLNKRYMLRQGSSISLEGLTFIIVATEPQSGVVTGETKFYTENNPAQIEALRAGMIQKMFLMVLISMIQRHGNRSRAPIDYRTILPEREITTGDIERGEKDVSYKECRVCLGNFEIDESVLTMPCMHYYHSTCLNRWLNTKNKCPICGHVL